MTYKINTDLDIYEVENNFYLRSPVPRLGKMLAHYELYKRIVNLPGAVIEMGVYKGASLMRFMAFRQLLENDSARAIIGFDAFGRFPVSDTETSDNTAFIKRFEAAGGDGIAKSDLEAAIAAKNIRNATLIEGDVLETLPAYIAAHPELRVALLHLDFDVYVPTRAVLDQLAARVVPGGLIVFDDYNMVVGATQAADEFAAANGLRLNKLPFYNVPAFIEMPTGRI